MEPEITSIFLNGNLNRKTEIAIFFSKSNRTQISFDYSTERPQPLLLAKDNRQGNTLYRDQKE